MAEVVAVIASTHHPFYYKASTAPPDEAPPFAAEWIAAYGQGRDVVDWYGRDGQTGSENPGAP